MDAHDDSYHSFLLQEIEDIQRCMSAWYNKVWNRRPMQWRNPPKSVESGPDRGYQVWVSEIMLQQTRVETVQTYYKRWMKEFPTIRALSQANVDDVLKLWAGLGYYSRARRLHEAACYLVEHFEGELPHTPDVLLRVPGIGPYTAGAVASIAFGEEAAVVDGNVIRVLSRMRALGGNFKASKETKRIWALASSLVRGATYPGDLNQALMELGSTLCSPKSPQCEPCPVKRHCKAWQEDKKKLMDRAAVKKGECKLCLAWESELGPLPGQGVTRYPRAVKKTKQREEITAVCVISAPAADGTLRWALQRRPAGGLLGGLWEFPAVVVSSGSPEQAVQKHVQQLLKKRWPMRHMGEVLHIFSHIRMTYVVYALMLGTTVTLSGSEQVKWATESDLGSLTTGMKKVLKIAQGKKKKREREEVASKGRKQMTLKMMFARKESQDM